ncbi:unnamed protein product [Lampetra planeri]
MKDQHLAADCIPVLPAAGAAAQGHRTPPPAAVLNLCNNRLKSVPAELGLLEKLHTLNLGVNLLTELPDSIGNLKELRHIGLSDNRFKHVPSCLARLHQVDRVNLDRNPVNELSSDQRPASAEFELVKKSDLCPDCVRECQMKKREMTDVVK